MAYGTQNIPFTALAEFRGGRPAGLEQQKWLTDPARLAEGFLISNFIWDPEPNGIPAKEMLKEGCWTLRYWRETFYKWHKGKYGQISDSELKSLISAYIQRLNSKSDIAGCIRISSQLIGNIISALSGFEGVRLPQERELNSWDDGRERCFIDTISFKNGLVMLMTRPERQPTPEIVKHTPRYFALTQLPYDYDPAAKADKFLTFLDEVMAGDKERIELLQQWAGYLLANDSRQQKFMLIAGEGANGKTVFTSMLEKMVGEENVSHVPLCQFGESFALAYTLGKVLNSTSESASRLDEDAETILKSYTSGDRMTFNRKYKEPIHTRPTAKIMVSTNSLPSFSDKSSGIWRRMLFVPFEVIIPPERQNLFLIEQLSEELPGIFNWACEGLVKLRQNGRFCEPVKCRHSSEQYRNETNPARAFLLENFRFQFSGIRDGQPQLIGEILPVPVIACKRLYEDYVEWCLENGYRPLNSCNFGKEVKRAFPNVRREQRTETGKRLTVYSGIYKLI